VRLIRRKTTVETKAQMTPLIDVVFLLIIFFMTVSEFSRLQTEDMILPESDQGRPAENVSTGRITVNIHSSADPESPVLVVEKRGMNLKQFRGLLDEARTEKGAEKVQVYVRAHRDTDFRAVKRVMATMARAGILRVTFAVADQEAKAP